MSNLDELTKLQNALSKNLTSFASNELAEYQTRFAENLKAINSFHNHPAYAEFAKAHAKLVENVNLSFFDEFAKTVTKSTENLNSNLSNFCHSVQKSVDAGNQTMKTLAKTLTPQYSFDYLTKTSTRLQELCQTLCTEAKIPTISPEYFDFLKNVDFKNESIELTTNDYDSINTILQNSTSNNAPLKVPERKITLIEFISIVLAVIGIILPMLQNSYYHKLDSIDSQKAHMEELQLKEKELHMFQQQLKNNEKQLELMEEILIELQNLSENYKSPQEAPGCPREVHKSPAEVPKPLGEVPYSADDTQDNALSSLDVSKNSKIDIHIA